MKTAITQFNDYLIRRRFNKISVGFILKYVKPFIDAHLNAKIPIDHKIITDYLFNYIKTEGLNEYNSGLLVDALHIYINDYNKCTIKFTDYCKRSYLKKDRLILNLHQVNKLLNNTTDTGDYLYFRLMASFGFKSDELIHIKIKEINIAEKQISILNHQTNSCRNFDLPADMLKKIKRHIDINNCGEWLFENKLGNMISKRHFEGAFKEVLVKTNINSDATLSSLRHFYGMQNIKKGTDAHILQNDMQFKNFRSNNTYKQTINPRINNIQNVFKHKNSNNPGEDKYNIN